MINNASNILINALLFFVFIAGTIFIIIFNVPYLLFVPLVIAAALKLLISHTIKIQHLVRSEFENLGYILISERPYRLSEMKSSIKFYSTFININGASSQQYGPVKRINRVFTAKHEDGNTYELFTTVIKTQHEVLGIEIDNKILLK